MTTEALRPFIPELLERRLAALGPAAVAPWEQRIDAAVLVADMTGFTALTDRLATRGPAGAEQLTDVVNARFGPIIDLIRAHGGDVVKFAGDATLALFPVDEAAGLGDAVARAADSGLAIQRALSEVAAPEGEQVRARVGIAAGPVWTGCVGGVANRWEYLVGGTAVVSAGAAAARAAPGDVVASSQAWSAADEAVVGQAIGDGYVVVTGAVSFPLEGSVPAGAAALPEALLQPFVPRALVDRLAAGHSRWLAEFRRVTVTSACVRDLDYQDARALERLQEVTAAVQEPVYRYDGSVSEIVVHDTGTTLVAAWGLPSFTHDDDAARGLEAATAMVDGLRRLGFAATAGVATGRALTGIRGNAARRAYAMLGSTVNVAGRLMEAAGSGVLADEETARAAAPRVECEATPPLTLKGMVRPVPVFRPRTKEVSVDTYPAGDHAIGRAMLGRRAERARVTERLEALRARGEGGVLLVEGEAGIGKSTLLALTLDEGAARDLTCLVGEADAIAPSTPYFVWRGPLFQLFAEGSDRQALAEGVRAALAEDPALAARVPLLNAVLPLELAETDATAGLESQVRADALRDLVVQLLADATARRPLVVMLDDAHWMDSGSWALALAVARRVPRLLLVMATQPIADPAPIEYGEILREARAERLGLTALDQEDALTLVRRRLGVTALPQPVAALIAATAGGNPFFAEQIAYELRDSGHLVIEQGDCRLAPEVTDLAALEPLDTVHDVLARRVDRLSPAEQLTLKVASVVGRTFPHRLLAQVYPVDEDGASLEEHLERLTALDLTMPEARDSELAYLFRHAIVQEVAYGLLTVAQRRTLHRAVAEWYEANVGDLERQLPLLVHHWTRAEVVGKALEYLGRAGAQALGLDANAEALRFFEQARTLDEAHAHRARPVARAAWERGTAVALVKLSRCVQSRPYFEESLRVLGRPTPGGTMAVAVAIVRQLAVQLWHRVRPTRARAARPEVLELAEVHRHLSQVSSWRNDLLRRLYHDLVWLNLAETVEESKELVGALSSVGLLAGEWTLHEIAGFYRRLGADVSARLGSPAAVGDTQEREAVYRLVIGDWDGARNAAERGERIFEELGDRRRWHTCFSLRGFGYLHQGRFDDASLFFADGLRAIGSGGAVEARIWSLAGLLATDLARDRVEPEAIAALEALLGPGLCQSDEILMRGLLAIARWREGDRSGALAHAEAATPLIHQFPPPSWRAQLATAYVAELYLELLEREAERASEWRHAAGRAVEGVWRFARLTGAAKPRAWLLRGNYAWLTGRPQAAPNAWRRSLAVAQDLDMPHEAALAHTAMARALPPEDPERASHLSQALELLGPLGAARDQAAALRLRGSG